MSDHREKIAVLIKHWIDHNEGHRTSYLEWRDKLADQDLPETLAALQRVADLTTEANAALEKAATELLASGTTPPPAGEHGHAHHHGEGEGQSHEQSEGHCHHHGDGGHSHEHGHHHHHEHGEGHHTH